MHMLELGWTHEVLQHVVQQQLRMLRHMQLHTCATVKDTQGK